MAEEVRRDRRAGERDEDEQDDEDAARDRDLVALEADPDELPVAPSADVFELAQLDAALGRRNGSQAGARAQNIRLPLIRRQSAESIALRCSPGGRALAESLERATVGASAAVACGAAVRRADEAAAAEAEAAVTDDVERLPDPPVAP